MVWVSFVSVELVHTLWTVFVLRGLDSNILLLRGFVRNIIVEKDLKYFPPPHSSSPLFFFSYVVSASAARLQPEALCHLHRATLPGEIAHPAVQWWKCIQGELKKMELSSVAMAHAHIKLLWKVWLHCSVHNCLRQRGFETEVVQWIERLFMEWLLALACHGFHLSFLSKYDPPFCPKAKYDEM